MNVITNNQIKCTIALASLQFVMDPEIGLNVVDLGLISQIDFDEGAKSIYTSMTLTTQFCPMGESITTAVTHAIEKVFVNYVVKVDVVFDPPWNHTMISEKGHDYLNQ